MSMRCPGCESQTMRTDYFHEEEIDSCHKCGGLWFENGELDKALSRADNGDDQVCMEQTIGDHLGVSERQCGLCNVVLQRYHLLDGYHVELDICHSCSGVWIDAHERDKVVRSPEMKQHLTELNRKTSVKSWFFQALSQMPVEFNIKPKTKPLLTYALIIANIFIFLAYGFDFETTRNVFDTYALKANYVLEGSHSWTLFSHMFLHGGFVHLAGNMYFLYVVGDNLEDVLGRGKFLLIYLTCGLAAAAAQLASNPDTKIAMVGASGAIAGLFGLYLLWFRHSSLTFMFIVYQKKLSPMVFFAIWLGINIYGLQMAGEGVAYWAHIGGFIAGLVIGLLLKNRVMAANPLLAMLNAPEVKIVR